KAALIDLRLPDGNGMALARELARRADGSPRPVFVMTGYPEELAEQFAVGGDAGSSASSVSGVSGEAGGSSEAGASGQAAREGVVILTKPFPVPIFLERLRLLV